MYNTRMRYSLFSRIAGVLRWRAKGTGLYATQSLSPTVHSFLHIGLQMKPFTDCVNPTTAVHHDERWFPSSVPFIYVTLARQPNFFLPVLGQSRDIAQTLRT